MSPTEFPGELHTGGVEQSAPLQPPVHMQPPEPLAPSSQVPCPEHTLFTPPGHVCPQSLPKVPAGHAHEPSPSAPSSQAAPFLQSHCWAQSVP